MDSLFRIISEYFAWLVAGSVLVCILSVWAASYLVIRIPAEYFMNKRRAVDDFAGLPLAIRWLILVVRQLIGLLLVLVGILMLIAPGQGVLTILAGIMLLRFPGKRRFVYWLVRRKGVLKTLNWIRSGAGKPPLEVNG